VAEARAFRRTSVRRHAGRLGEFRPVLRELSGKVLPNGELADHASPALARIRRQIEQHRKAVHRSLERFVREHYQEGTLQEDYVTIRNGRLVVPVKTTW
jgi:DNA mismatch repair protein MutS2